MYRNYNCHLLTYLLQFLEERIRKYRLVNIFLEYILKVLHRYIYVCKLTNNTMWSSSVQN